MKGNPPSMAVIAQQAGVSRATVSRALRNDPRLALATRRRIQTIAAQLGYTLDPVYSAIMTQVQARKSPRQVLPLAFLTSDPTREGWRASSELYHAYFVGAAEHARQLGYRLEEFWAKEPGMTSRRLSTILFTRGIRGVLVAPLPRALGHLSLDWSKFAAVALGYSLRRPELHRVAHDPFQMLRLMLRHLKHLGYRRIGLALPTATTRRVDDAYVAALLLYQQDLPAVRRIPPLLLKDWNDRAFLHWFRRHQPDAVIAHAPGAVKILRASGVRVPEDVGCAALQLGAETSCAGIRFDGKAVGAAAVDLLVGALQRNEFGVPPEPKMLLAKVEWCDGPTVRRR